MSIKALAETHLADYALATAMGALRAIDNTTNEAIPDEALVAAARHYLETIDDPDGPDPGSALRDALLDLEQPP